MEHCIEYERIGERPDCQQYVLLSGSPRRRELLAFLQPSIQTVEIDERRIEQHFMEVYQEDPFLQRAAQTCCEISKAKSDGELAANTLYISADTIVVHRDQIYNKPTNEAEAFSMLRSYFGEEHYVVTSVCLRAQHYLEVFYTVTGIRFVEYYEALTSALHDYVASGEPMDKSGSYGIQSLDPRFVERIDGDLYTVIGLPVAELSRRLNV